MDQLDLLKLRNLIVKKEWIVSSANHDVLRYGGWERDWRSEMLDVDKEINVLLQSLDGE